LFNRRDETPVVELQKSNPVRVGVIVVVITVIVVYFGFTKHIPFKHGFRLNAEFATTVDIRPKSPVRIAGVNVGKVASIKRTGNAGEVLMEIEGKGLPIHEDATLKIKPRIFLEGNWFVELQPGTPSTKTVSSGYTIPITQTSNTVQIDQVLSALNEDTRTNLQEFLAEYGRALTEKPTKAQDAIQDPEVRGLDGAQALNKSYQRGPASLRGGAIVSQALGGTEEHDLSKLIAGIGKVTGALNVHEQDLGEWVDNFDSFVHSLAAQSQSLSQTVAELPGAVKSIHRAFVSLNAGFPALRSFALALVPGVEQAPSMIAAGLPWIEQTKASLAADELGGVAIGLQEGAPWVAKLTGTQNSFQQQTDEFSKCLTNVIFPAGNTKLQDGPSTTGVESYREFWYTMAGLAGIGQNFNGNGTFIRGLVGGGGDAIRSSPASEIGSTTKGLSLVARTPFPPQGTRPAFPASEPPYKPLVPCSTQAVPNFNGSLSQGPADGGGG
jgi:ABC-type transporter Mla subunit MlaD